MNKFRNSLILSMRKEEEDLIEHIKNMKEIIGKYENRVDEITTMLDELEGKDV
jgi:hypothetical protein